MPVRILMVCLGNICRSPLAEGVMASMADPSEVWVDSAGTAGYHVGNPPDPRSVATAARYGIDISRQRCRKFVVADFEEFDYIFAMDQENLAHIHRMAPDATRRAKAALLLEAGGMGAREVPDPYYGGDAGFEHVYQLVTQACSRILARITQS